MLDKLTDTLNAKPVFWTLILGLGAYFCAFCLAIVAMASGLPLIFEISFLSAGAMVIAYHWVISRYLRSGIIAQAIQLTLGTALIAISMMLVGAMFHFKTYAWLSTWLFKAP